MKLDLFRTVKIGFAFLAICAFWQLYNNVIPLILTDTFHLNESVSGVIMAADNVLALVLLPVFGTISDKTVTRIGRRKPFIILGTLVSAVLMLFIPMLDNMYYKNGDPGIKPVLITVLGLLLIAMGVYRSPAVALMPDLTPKPLRSQGNAVINLMGALGGIIYLILASVLYSKKRIEGLEHVDYFALFLIVALIMVFSAIVIMVGVDEVKLRKETEELEIEYERNKDAATFYDGGQDDGTAVLEADEIESADEAIKAIKSSRGKASDEPEEIKRSMIFLLIAVAMWFMGYNAVETWITTFAGHQWGLGLGEASLAVTVATAGAIVSYAPVGLISEKIGRKKSIILGIILLAASFGVMFTYSLYFNTFSKVLYAVFLVIGFAWAAINVNSLPMVLEMCRDEDIGRYTGYYYFFSMTAQIATPILAGFCLNRIGYWTLFLYSTVFVLLSFCAMTVVKHGDVK